MLKRRAGTSRGNGLLCCYAERIREPTAMVYAYCELIRTVCVALDQLTLIHGVFIWIHAKDEAREHGVDQKPS
jgi:hypothetical protein